MTMINNEIIKAELVLKNLVDLYADSDKMIKAIDILMGTPSNYPADGELTLKEAAQIIVEAPQVACWEVDILELRNRLVKRQADGNKSIEAHQREVDDLKSEAYDRTRIWINNQIDILEGKLFANKELSDKDELIINIKIKTLESCFEALEGPWGEKEEDNQIAEEAN